MAQERQRLGSLDGLRGIAALVVVIFHAAVSDASVGRLYKIDHQPEVGPLTYLMSYTPLRMLWGGSEAVVVFFALSGFVLALPFARGRGPRWREFYPRRLVRLYIPAAASLVFAYLTTVIVVRHVIPGGSPWLNSHADEPHGPAQVLVGSTLFGGWGGLNASLWSLRFEVVFSILLPLFVLVARTAPRLIWVKVGGLVFICLAWPLIGIFYPDAVYLVVFAFGVLLAYNFEVVRRVASRVGRWGWTLVFLVALALLSNSWIIAGWDLTSRARAIWILPAAIGATFLVILAACCPAAVRFLSWRPVHWLGTISFSLYLVQEPVVVGLAFWSGGRVPLWLALPLSVSVAVMLGWLFHRAVERPAHRLARSIGRRPAQQTPDNPTKTTDLTPVLTSTAEAAGGADY